MFEEFQKTFGVHSGGMFKKVLKKSEVEVQLEGGG